MTSPASTPSFLGYTALREMLVLRCPTPRVESRLASSARTTTRTVNADGTEEVLYPATSGYPRYTGIAGHLEFALRYEPLDLCVMAALFERPDSAEAVQTWLAASPRSKYARIAGHLFEWLTGASLSFSLPAGAPRVPVLDPEKYFVGPSIRSAKFGVVHNLIGTRKMCPVVRRTPALAGVKAELVRERVSNVVASIDPGLLDRALTFLYLAETQSSFAIEKEIPDHAKREAFRRLLEQAGAPGRLSEEAFVAWQHAIITQPLRQEHSFRTRQNWLSKGSSLRAAVDYVPPRPADVHEMMEGVADIAEQSVAGHVDPVIAAACASFAMVFVHPFFDGNGRLHRFLLHHVLRQTGVTPKGIVLPLSVALEANLADYAAALQRYSLSRTRLLDYRLDPDTNSLEVRGPQPAWLYAYFDATEICELVWKCIDRALVRDLPAEVAWLRAYDAAMTRLSYWLDGAQAELDLLIRLIVQNEGRLSKNKRERFSRFTDAEIERAESEISEAFKEWREQYNFRRTTAA